MSIQSLTIKGFRSIRKITLELSELNIISGPNGCGKSNLYKAVRLLHDAANGNLSKAIADEGGIQKVMWAGGARYGDQKKDPKRLLLAAEMQSYEYQIEIGFPPPSNDIKSLFTLDPLVKTETIWLSGFDRRPTSKLMERINQAAFLKNIDNMRVTFPSKLNHEEALFGQLSDPHKYPEVSEVREEFKSWRFYHDFNVSSGSQLRQPQIGIRSPILSHDGANLAATYETIKEIGDIDLLENILQKAFPRSNFFVTSHQGRFQIHMNKEGILRPLESTELSDGTLRFLCLTVALLSPRPPSFLALNEPENSLHPNLLPALSSLISEASQFTQIWVTTHSSELVNLIKKQRAIKHYQLNQVNGETLL